MKHLQSHHDVLYTTEWSHQKGIQLIFFKKKSENDGLDPQVWTSYPSGKFGGVAKQRGQICWGSDEITWALKLNEGTLSETSAAVTAANDEKNKQILQFKVDKNSSLELLSAC